MSAIRKFVQNSSDIFLVSLQMPTVLPGRWFWILSSLRIPLPMITPRKIDFTCTLDGF